MRGANNLAKTLELRLKALNCGGSVQFLSLGGPDAEGEHQGSFVHTNYVIRQSSLLREL